MHQRPWLLAALVLVHACLAGAQELPAAFLPAEPTLKAAIAGALAGCESAAEVQTVFAWVGYP